MFLQGSSLCDGQPAGVQPLPSKTVPNVAPIHYWESVWCAWALAFGGSKISCLETTLTSKCQTLHRNMSKQKWIHRLLMFFLSSKYQNIFEALIVVPRDQLTVEAGLSKNKARYLSEEMPNWTSSWKSRLLQFSGAASAKHMTFRLESGWFQRELSKLQVEPPGKMLCSTSLNGFTNFQTLTKWTRAEKT